MLDNGANKKIIYNSMLTVNLFEMRTCLCTLKLVMTTWPGVKTSKSWLISGIVDLFVRLKAGDDHLAWGDDTHVLNLLNSFLYKGPYGNHFCMVFEILGVNLLEVLKRYDYKGLPLDLVKEITRQVLMGLDFLNRICRVIHTDLKPENVLLCLTDGEIKQIVESGQLSSK